MIASRYAEKERDDSSAWLIIGGSRADELESLDGITLDNFSRENWLSRQQVRSVSMREGYLDFSFDFNRLVQGSEYWLSTISSCSNSIEVSIYFIERHVWRGNFRLFWINQPLSSLENFSRNPHRSTFASRSDWVTSMPCAIEINGWKRKEQTR